MRWIALAAALGAALPATAEEADRSFRLAVPPVLAESGLLDYILPRFSLKTATRITVVGPGEPADASFGSEGRPAFEGPERSWSLSVGGDPDARAFSDWLGKETGRAAVAGFEVDGAAPFAPAARSETVVAGPDLEGDAERGQRLALLRCGRCHVVGPANRMKAIGSTPSFGVLRTFPDWLDRFRSFYALNPHPAFTAIEEVTPPFAADRPPTIVPLELTLDELDDILAYVGALAPAELGAEVEAR